MTWKSTLKIHNNSDADLERMAQDSTHMDTWNFPQKISANSTCKVPIAFNESLWIPPEKDHGSVIYQASSGFRFRLKAFVNIDCFISVVMEAQEGGLFMSPQGDLEIPRNSERELNIFKIK